MSKIGRRDTRKNRRGVEFREYRCGCVRSRRQSVIKVRRCKHHSPKESQD